MPTAALRSILLVAALATAVVPLGGAGPAPAPGGVTPAAAAPAPEKLRLAPMPAGAPRVSVSVARARDFTRLTIQGPVRANVTQRGDLAVIQFARAAQVDLAALAGKAQFIADVGRRNEPSGTVVEIRLAPDAEFDERRDGAAIVLDFSAKPPPQPEVAAAAPAAEGPEIADAAAAPAAERAAANPFPPGGLPVQGRFAGTDLELVFSFTEPTAAAVFRRGDAVWILVPHEGAMRVEGLAALGPRLGNVQPVSGEGVSGVRIVTALNPTIAGSGETWRVRFAPAQRPPSRAIEIARLTSPTGGGRLQIAAPMASAVRWMEDPDAGDRFAIGFMDGPASGLLATRNFLQALFTPTAHGVVMTPRADDVDLRLAINGFAAMRPEGLLLSASKAAAEDGGFTTADPGFVDFAAWRRGSAERFQEIHDQLQRAAAMEGGTKGGPTRARMDLARFLIAWELAPEALGAMRALAAAEPGIESTPDFRGLRGAARAMLGRFAEARSDLSAASVLDDPAAQVWAAYAAAGQDDWPEAKRLFEAYGDAIGGFAPDWRSRFLEARARTALALGELDDARRFAREAVADARAQSVKAQALLTDGRSLVAVGQPEDALKVFTALARAPQRDVAAQAAYEMTMLRLALNKATPEQTIDVLDGMRYSWRGDGLELDVLRQLGELHFAEGRTREALMVMRAGATLRPDLPAARRLREDLSQRFRALYLAGEADALEPLEALALFYDFRDLTPIGAEGDLMVRGLVDRLVAFDLLPQAAELLDHQTNTRFEGIAKAQVATDLAAIYLMDRQPEKALKAIADSRVARLPERLNTQRRLIQAAALSDLGRPDHALETIADDRSLDATRLRAEIHWRAQNWAAASQGLRAALPRPSPGLTPEAAMDVLRAAVATSLAGDAAGVATLRARYGAAMADSAEADSFAAVTSAASAQGGDISQVVARLADVSPYDALLKRVRERVAGPAPSDPLAGAITRRATDEMALAGRGRPGETTDAAAVAAEPPAPRRAAAAPAARPAAG